MVSHKGLEINHELSKPTVLPNPGYNTLPGVFKQSMIRNERFFLGPCLIVDFNQQSLVLSLKVSATHFFIAWHSLMHSQ